VFKRDINRSVFVIREVQLFIFSLFFTLLRTIIVWTKMGLQCIGDMLISTESPYKIQSVSNKICTKLHYKLEQLLSRSINILFGPNTDARSFYCVLKQHHSFVDPYGYCYSEEISKISVYDSKGRGHLVLFVCHPEINENKIAGFTLRFYNQSTHTDLDPIMVPAEQDIEKTSSSFLHLPSRGFSPVLIPGPPQPSKEEHGIDWRDELELALMTLDAFSIVDRGCKAVGDPATVRAEPLRIAGSLVISARAPHTVLGTSPELCSLLGFSSAEMTQRSVRFLYGPETYPSAIPSAVKRLFAHEACTIASVPAVTIHDRSGAPHVVRIECTRVPELSGSGCGAAACRVRLEWPAEPLASRGPPVLPACLWSLS
jgi:hypothetical protein